MEKPACLPLLLMMMMRMYPQHLITSSFITGI
jgi:hypothetical protein